ncbi:uncharacterized protein DEA37_0002675 [Paragonimus westermani]|uniref:Uncharacterized protein n=1 Tax=Paragonimus westermani TaxID=34504 RepID=A0A5J4NQG2_9TREM|nr:uncharacterized protein DEA37_0002675 [Paragonimus westermani]
MCNTHTQRINSVFRTSSEQRTGEQKPMCIIQDLGQDKDSLRDWLFKDLPARLHVWDARSTLFNHFLVDLFFRRLLHYKPPLADSEWPTCLTDAILNIIPQVRQCLRDRSEVIINPEAPTTGTVIEACTIQPVETNLEAESTTNWATCDGFLAPVTNKKSVKQNKREKDPPIEFERIHAVDINAMRHHQVRQLRLMQKFVRQAFANWNQRRGHSTSSTDRLIPQTVVPSLDWTGLWRSRLKTTRRGVKRASLSVGLHEQRANAFLTNCQVGSVENIKTLLLSDPVVGMKHVTLDLNVADQYGCFGLLWAVLAWNEQLVNLLLDFGANVNQVTDEGLCALSACLLYYYRAIEQLSSGSEGKDSMIKPHIRICRPYCQSEDSSSTPSAQNDEQCERTFVFLAEITMFLSNKSPESEKEQQQKAKMAQMQRLYTSRPQIVESLRAKSNVISAKEQDTDREIQPEHLCVKPKLPTFQRFTDCLTRLTKQFQDNLTYVDPITQKTREFSIPERISSPSLSDRTNSPLSNCHEELPTHLEETQLAKVENLTSEENAVPFSRRSLYEHPIRPTTAAYLDASANELAQNTYFLAKRSISPATLSRTGRESDDKISDSLEMNAESNSAVQRRAVLIAQGADPNAANQPLPCIFMAVQMEDIEMVDRLLKHGADANACLRIKSQSEQKHNLYSKPPRRNTKPMDSNEMLDRQDEKRITATEDPIIPSLDGLAPLHYAALLPGDAGVQIVRLLCNAAANPNHQAMEDDSFIIRPNLNSRTEETTKTEFTKSIPGTVSSTPERLTPEQQNIIGGRTALQLACARDYDYECIDVLLKWPTINVNQELSHGMGTALSVAAARTFEFRRTTEQRLALIRKLVEIGGASAHHRFHIPSKHFIGNVVDATYLDYLRDRRVGRLPFHALNNVEKEVYEARAQIMDYLADCVRDAYYEIRELTDKDSSRDATGGRKSRLLLTHSQTPLLMHPSSSARSRTISSIKLGLPAVGK